jgi:IS5 family transposase
MQEIQRMTPRHRERRQLGKYRELIRTTVQVLENARGVLVKTRDIQCEDPVADIAVNGVRREIEHYSALGDRVVDQARRRVLQGEGVPVADKIFSIFEPHTDLIMRGKADKPVEFGHKVFLAESAAGLITQYRVLNGNPCDEIHVEPSLREHKEMFGEAPTIYGSDRGFYSQDNVAACTEAGVKITCIPQRGGKKTPEREAFESSPPFKKGQRFRAGIEGRISVLFRGRGMKRAFVEGRERFEMLIGAAVLANNLMIIANLLNKRKKKAA